MGTLDRSRLLAGIACAALVVLAACGGDDSGSAASTAAAVATEAATTTTAAELSVEAVGEAYLKIVAPVNSAVTRLNKDQQAVGKLPAQVANEAVTATVMPDYRIAGEAARQFAIDLRSGQWPAAVEQDIVTLADAATASGAVFLRAADEHSRSVPRHRPGDELHRHPGRRGFCSGRRSAEAQPRVGLQPDRLLRARGAIGLATAQLPEHHVEARPRRPVAEAFLDASSEQPLPDSFGVETGQVDDLDHVCARTLSVRPGVHEPSRAVTRDHSYGCHGSGTRVRGRSAQASRWGSNPNLRSRQSGPPGLDRMRHFSGLEFARRPPHPCATSCNFAPRRRGPPPRQRVTHHPPLPVSRRILSVRSSRCPANTRRPRDERRSRLR